MKMENDIEICVADSDDARGSEMNFDLITRYYQFLLGQIESGAGEFLCNDLFVKLTNLISKNHFKILN